MLEENGGTREVYICLCDIFGRADPFDLVAELLDGVYETADVPSDIVEEVDGRHGGWSALWCAFSSL